MKASCFKRFDKTAKVMRVCSRARGCASLACSVHIGLRGPAAELLCELLQVGNQATAREARWLQYLESCLSQCRVVSAKIHSKSLHSASLTPDARLPHV